MAVTAKDVAREAGVSPATVSYVINDTPSQKISPATRQRVMDAVDKLGYLPSEAARRLRRGTSDTVLFLLPDVPIGFAVAQFIEILTDVLDRTGLKLATRRVRSGVPLHEVWAGLRPVAVALLGEIDPADEEQLRAAGIPIVGTLLSMGPGRDTASVPQTVIGRLQVEHLAATGHTVIGYAAPDDSRVSEFYRRRLQGVRIDCLELGLDEPVVIPVHLEVASAEDAVMTWLARGVTGIAAYNDDTAFAVLAGMHRLGLSAPSDLAVIGVDNITLASLASPPLTTIDQGIDTVATYLARLLVHYLHGGPKPGRLSSDTVTLVVRESA